VGKLVRKNLMVDAEALSELARALGTSESQAARDAISMALGRFGMVAAVEKLHELGAFADFEQLYPPLEPELEENQASRARRRAQAPAK
jgi:hypothetical protein